MTAKTLTEEELREAVNLVKEHDGSVTRAAAAAKFSRSTLDNRYRRALQLLPEHNKKYSDLDGEVQLPVFPDENISTEQMLNHLEKQFNKREEYQRATQWFDIKIKSDAPYGLVVVGDPHLGQHTNWPLIRRDVEIMATTPGLGIVNIGDTTNNWGGRLIAIYADEDVSKSTERQLAKWFLSEASIPWLVWLHGNHDTMHTEFSTYLKAINVQQIPMLDWSAKFKLVFPSATIAINAAHNHKGTSIYNPLHGQRRADLWGEGADIFVAGHHHTWALQQHENEGGKVVTYARARGYKKHDEFARRHGFNEERYGASIIFVIDPTAAPPSRVQPFADLKEGAEFLKFKRSA